MMGVRSLLGLRVGAVRAMERLMPLSIGLV
jgi:hypothetical protein